MRRMRDFSGWNWMSAASALVALGFGSYYVIHKGMTRPAQQTVAKELPKAAPIVPTASVAAIDEREEQAVGEADSTVFGAPEQLVGTSGQGPGNACASAEFRGAGWKQTKVSAVEWKKFMKQYHSVKVDLLAWLKKHQSDFPAPVVATMRKSLEDLRIQRAPSSESPDLSWRGIGVLTRDQAGQPILRVGGGFLDLFHTQPKRARFELARLTAQIWAPCELKKAQAGDAWASLLGCFEVDGSCAEGSYSEAGWAVSTAIASFVAPPGCNIPAFDSPKMAACLDIIKRASGPVQREIASEAPMPVERVLEESDWKRARKDEVRSW